MDTIGRWLHMRTTSLKRLGPPVTGDEGAIMILKEHVKSLIQRMDSSGIIVNAPECHIEAMESLQMMVKHGLNLWKVTSILTILGMILRSPTWYGLKNGNTILIPCFP